MSDLLAFLECSLENWAAFATGLPVKRSYTSEKGLTLHDELRTMLDHLRTRDGDALTYTLILPSEGGAGTTTLLRSAAFRAAEAGYPTLILRPEQVDINLEDLRAFATVLSEKCELSKMDDAPPMVIVLDVEHWSNPTAKALPQFLSGHGHRAVVLRGAPKEQSAAQEVRGKRVVRLRPLLSSATEDEISKCEEAFRKIVERWKLPMEIPSIEQWRAFESATRWRFQTSADTISSFWVALRFFLTQEVEFSTGETIANALGAWIHKRTSRVSDDRMQRLLLYVAVLSSFRIPSPIWTVLRPVTGGTFSSMLVDLFKQLNDIVIWGASSEELDDQVLRFAHPSLADEYLRQEGIHNLIEKAQAVKPVLMSLSPGHQGDVWVAESLAADIIAPTFGERRESDWGWRLEFFDVLPPILRDQSKTILHHWARCLYQSADSGARPPIPDSERRQRTELAIDKLKLALALPRRTGRDENPSHLYNTLGVAYARYAKFLEDTGVGRLESNKAWIEACRAFEQSIQLQSGTNLDALLAFSSRLLIHAEESRVDHGNLSPGGLADVSYALTLLDGAEDVQQDYATDDPDLEREIVNYTARALNLLRDGAGIQYLRELQISEKSDLGYYCEARLALIAADPAQGLESALTVLQSAEDHGIKLEPRSLLLRLTLLRRHPVKRFEFASLLNLYRELETHLEYHPRPIDLYRHAVLCYQTGAYSEGADRFRKLRELLRKTGNTPPRVKDFWRVKDNPAVIRISQLKVTRIVSEWRGQAYVEDFGQTVPFRPLHFSPQPRENSVVDCAIRFGPWGPFAIPPRDVDRPRPRRT